MNNDEQFGIKECLKYLIENANTDTRCKELKELIDEIHIIEWKQTMEEVKNYIRINGKKPSINDKDPKVRELAEWICEQNRNCEIEKKRRMIK